MHEAALSRAAIPTPAVALEMLLRPLSLWHMVSLIRGGLIEPIGSGQISAIQLTECVLICCRTHQESVDIKPDILAPLKMWAWKKRVARAARGHAKLKLPGTYIETQSARFADYMREGSIELPISSIPRTDSGSRSRLSGCPFVLILQQWLMVTFGMTESQAWDYPLALAKMRWACHWEQAGALDIAGELDVAMDAAIERDEAEYRKSKES